MDTLMAFLKVESGLELAWVAFGLIGQLMFTARFLVQWVASERVRRSIIPTAFWYFSLAGGSTLLTYAIYRQDPVFILGQSLGVFIYTRNLWLIHKSSRENAAEQKDV